MAKLDMVYDGEFFLKVRPTDNTQEIENSIKEFKVLKHEYETLRESIGRKEFVTRSDVDELNDLYKNLMIVKANTSIPSMNTNGMDHFWELGIRPNSFVLTTIPNNANDEFILNEYKNLDMISKEYRSVPDIVENSEFIGRRKHFEGQDHSIYMLYRYEEGTFGYLVDDQRNAVIGFAIAYDPFEGFKPNGDNIPELDSPGLLYRFINKLKNRG